MNILTRLLQTRPCEQCVDINLVLWLMHTVPSIKSNLVIEEE